MSAAWDPWEDAQRISQHLRQPGAELLVIIGAEAWCEKCQRLRPAYEALCLQTMPPHVVWLWLDLEDHNDFLGTFIPPDLPLLLRWRDGSCIQAAVVQDIAPDRPPADRVRLKPLTLAANVLVSPDGQEHAELPALWETFRSDGWAQG